MGLIGRQKGWTTDELLDIRDSFVSGMKQIDLAKKYNTTQKTISKIVNLQVYSREAIPVSYYQRYQERTGRPLIED